MAALFRMSKSPAAPEADRAHRPFFDSGPPLRKDERDEAILSGKLPPGSSELEPRPTEYRLASWLSPTVPWS